MKRAEEISAAFSSEDPEQRRRAVESLRELGSEIETPARYVLSALGDDDWRVRKQAIEVAIALAPAVFPNRSSSKGHRVSCDGTIKPRS